MIIALLLNYRHALFMFILLMKFIQMNLPYRAIYVENHAISHVILAYQMRYLLMETSLSGNALYAERILKKSEIPSLNIGT